MEKILTKNKIRSLIINLIERIEYWDSLKAPHKNYFIKMKIEDTVIDFEESLFKLISNPEEGDIFDKLSMLINNLETSYNRKIKSTDTLINDLKRVATIRSWL